MSENTQEFHPTPPSSSVDPAVGWQAPAPSAASARALSPTVATADIPRGPVRWGSVALFLVLTFAVTWAIWGVGITLHWNLTIYAAIGMFVPALMATIVRLARHEGFADAGLRLGRRGQRGTWRLYLAAYLGIPALLLVGVGIALASTYQHWDLATNLTALAHTLISMPGANVPRGLSLQQLGLIVFVANLVEAFTLAIPINMIATFGEEFGWRGFLLMRLAPLGGARAAVLTGIIWGLWHAPLIAFVGYNYPGHPVLGILMMVVFTVCLGVFFAWLRFRSGSVWPSTLAHAAINAQAGVAALLLSSGDSLIRAPLGILGLIPMALLAIYLIWSGRLAAAR